MQKLIWKNSKGELINLTAGNFGITNWEGFSNTSLEIQTQQVPFQDGGVFIDALLEQRELNVTLAMYDGGDLELRYSQRRQLIKALNPKLGEGYLIYKNDFIEKRIKCIPQIPIFENHNSNDGGTPKASLSWTACEPYWEDLEETVVDLNYGVKTIINNNGDIPCGVNIQLNINDVVNPTIKNFTQNKFINLNGNFKNNVFINTNVGEKSINEELLSFDLKNIRNTLNSIDYSENLGLFVAVGEDSTILTSSDGINWTGRDISDTNNIIANHKPRFRAVTYSKKLNLFVTIGVYGSEIFHEYGVICYSSDGINWDTVNIDVNVDPMYGLMSIAYSESLGLFIITTRNGPTYNSTDGINWTRSTNSNLSSSKIIWCEEKLSFIMLQSPGILISTDGINWTFMEINPSYTNYHLEDLTYSKKLDLLVITGSCVNEQNETFKCVFLTNDFSTWVLTPFENITLTSITYSESLGLFVVFCWGENKIFTSKNAISWNETSLSEYLYSDIKSVIFSNLSMSFIAVGVDGVILNSIDGINWNKISNNFEFYCIFYSEELHLFLGLNSYSIYSSEDCANWNFVKFYENGNLPHKICYAKNKNLYVGINAYYSSDGINWNPPIQPPSISGEAITYSESLGLFVMCGNRGRSAYSSDGMNWTDMNIGGSHFFGITYSETLGLFVAVGAYGVISYSSDGMNWTYITIADSNITLNSIDYSENLGLFVAVGNSTILTSPNGIDWVSRINDNNVSYYNIKYFEKLGSYFICGTANNKCVILTSSNGIDWVTRYENIYSSLSECIYSNEKNIIVAYSNLLVLVSNYLIDKNIISKLSIDSNMTLSLETGKNEISIFSEIGSFTGSLKYRQKYIGV